MTLPLRITIAAMFLAVTGLKAQTSVEYRRALAVDSMNIRYAQSSPDGKWVLMHRGAGGVAGSLWIVPAAGGTPMRLTSDGYNDSHPHWFWSNDRISFLSTRPNRNGGRQQYLMTLAIDPATGRATSAPRQVTSEPVGRTFPPSRDGRWIAYMSTGAVRELRLVPSTGGTARTLAVPNPPVTGVTFSADGRHLYYTDQVGPNGGPCANGICTWTIHRLNVEGGQNESIASASHAIAVLPADPRYVLHRLAGARRNEFTWELRDAGNALLGRLQEPSNIRFMDFTGDGYGITGLTWDWQRVIKVASIAGGPLQTVTRGDGRYPEAWTADGSALVTDRYENSRLTLEITAFNGRPLRSFPLGEGWHSSGWQSNVGPWYSYQSTNPPGLHAINLETGEKKQITNAAVESHAGRGGMEQDGDRWVYSQRAGDRLEFRSTNPATGETMLLRSFSDDMGKRSHFQAHGTRLAWYEARGDSIDFLVTFGPTGAPRRIFSRQGTLGAADETAAWSNRGDRLAICCDNDNVVRSVTLYSIPSTADGPVSSEKVNVGPVYALWAPKWMPADSALMFLAIVDRREDIPDLVYFPLRSGAQWSVLTRDEPHEIWSYMPSPDGRHVAFYVDLPVHRTTVSVASFRTLIEGRR